MKYLHSRLALAGVVVAWPLTQLGGCAQKERNFAPAGTGGDSANGGMSGEDTGATGGKGGTVGGKGGTSGGKGGTTGGTAGKGGTGGSTAGKGGATTGGTGGKGGGTSGGTGGSGNENAGGEAGQMVIDPTCEPTGSEVCNDGVDNDCDTLTDCLTFVSSFPEETGAAAGAHVNYTFGPKHSTASFQCRAAKGTTLSSSAAWGTCARVNGNTAFPISGAASTDPATDGVWTTEVRLTFPDGSHSRAFRRQVYIHSSMNADSPCTAEATDEQYFAAAAADLEDTGAFTDTTTARNPFVAITFTPPVDGRYYVFAGDGAIRTYSLRRRFTFSSDGHFLLMTRRYPSRMDPASGCTVVRKRVHNMRGSWSIAGRTSYQSCTGFVMNSQGAGFCVSAAGGTVTPAEWVRLDGAVQLPDSIYSPRADNFAWRKVFLSKNAYGYQTHFSPACEVEGCASMTALFLPDASQYTYW